MKKSLTECAEATDGKGTNEWTGNVLLRGAEVHIAQVESKTVKKYVVHT